jgi:glycine/D-amino acid oxidase-like deaminating enzyme
MEETDVLIVGQGLAGTWLSWWLEKAGISYTIIDDPATASASRFAAGLINPVTGRRLVKTWMIEELMPFAWKAYREMGSFLQTDLISETTVIDFFPTVQMLEAFRKRYSEDTAYLHLAEKAQGLPGISPEEEYENHFRFDLGWGAINPCYLVQTEKLLSAWRNQLREKNLLREEWFDSAKLTLSEKLAEYADIRSRYIIFCDGKYAASNRFFEKLPFALNKGEGLLVEVQNIPRRTVFKKGMSLVPWKEDIFWVGSSYQWQFADEQPSADFRSFAENWLKNFLKVPFKVIEHFAALRPATLERRPFVGFHPEHPRVGIFNGLGTKGCSLAPWFAAQLAERLRAGKPVDPLADIHRFERILMRG